MSDQFVAYLMLGLFIAQFLLFLVATAYGLSALQHKGVVESYRAKILGGWGLLLMMTNGFIAQVYLAGHAAFNTWLGAVSAGFFGIACLWLGSLQRRVHLAKQAKTKK